ncbi:hypothetical protein [uncultured Cohaesibacter sp.]|uniref:hypothetical protein n=1 Tax=uncultured Cohaesibacter sp. TaxID=1002546 RepID=UPI0029C8EFE4|nr:hypothetical protein [uncultured Cohaesibacter sp.]
MSRAAKSARSSPRAAGAYRPPIAVRPWRDPVSGNVFFSVNGPMQMTDPKARVMSPGELLDLRACIDAALACEVV